MKRKFLIVLLSLILVLTVGGCKKLEEPKIVHPMIKFEEIYRIDNERLLFSSFDAKYVKEGKEIELKDALEQNIVTIADIIGEMDYYTTGNDGGFTYYKYSGKKKIFGNKDFYLVKCNSLLSSGNIKDIFISDNETNILQVCTK